MRSRETLQIGPSVQGVKKLRLINRFPKDCRGLCHLNIGVASRHNHANTFAMQPIDQVVGLLASAEIQVNETALGMFSEIRRLMLNHRVGQLTTQRP